MATSTYKTPKGCIVHRVSLRNGIAEIGYRCGSGSSPQDEHGREGPFTHPGGGSGNYPEVYVKARAVDFRGVSISGDANMGFVLSPAAAKCEKRKSDVALRCHLVGDTGSGSLRGARKRKRR